MITLKNSDDLDKMRFAGKVASDALTFLTPFIKPGITTLEIDRKAEMYIRSRGCLPAFKEYKGFPFTICASVNQQAVHCKPSEYVLKGGDVFKVDIGAINDEFYSDTAKTFIVGDASEEVKKFVDVGYLSMWAGIKNALDGKFVSDISNSVYLFSTSRGYGVVPQFVGHGIGKTLHEEPQIPNTPLKDKGPELCNGMVICIEPILTMSKDPSIVVENEWSVFSQTGAPVAHFEHTIAITPNGPEVLTLRVDEKYLL